VTKFRRKGKTGERGEDKRKDGDDDKITDTEEAAPFDDTYS
jgi:hypothetical protein